MSELLEPELTERIMARIRQVSVCSRIGLVIESLASGRCVARAPHDKGFDGAFNSFHGGMLGMVADTIACFAVMTQTGPEQRMATTDFNIRFLTPCFTDIRAVAQTIKVGRTLCPVQVDLYDAAERHVAVAQVTYIRLPS